MPDNPISPVIAFHFLRYWESGKEIERSECVALEFRRIHRGFLAILLSAVIR